MAIRVKVPTGIGVIRDRKVMAGEVQYLVGFKNRKYVRGECRVWYYESKCTPLLNTWQKLMKLVQTLLANTNQRDKSVLTNTNEGN